MNERWASPYWLASMQAQLAQPVPSQSLPTTLMDYHHPNTDHVSNRTRKQKPSQHSRRLSVPHPMPLHPAIPQQQQHPRIKRKPVPPAALDDIHIASNDQDEPDPIARPSHPLKSLQNQQIMLRSPLSVSSTSSLFELSSPSSVSSTSSCYKRQSLPPENRHQQFKPHKLNRIRSARPEASDDDDDDDDSPREDQPQDTSVPTFWNPRPGADIGAPLRRNFSRKLKGLLQPHKLRIESATKDQHAANRLWSVGRTKTPPPCIADPKLLNPFRILSNALPVADQMSLDFEQENFVQIDTYTSNVNQRGPMLTPTLLAQKFLARPYRRDLYKIRSIFVWIVQNIMIDSSLPDNHISPDKVLAQRTCSAPLAIANLFVAMTNAIDIEAQVVFGYLRGQKDTLAADGMPVENHAWCAVKVQGEYRFVDCWLASPYYHANENTMETHWFLSSPLDMIYTHFPSNTADQYLEPPVSINTFFALPYVCIPFFRHHINVINYHPGEMNHITLQVDRDIACYAEVETRTQHESNRTTIHRTRGLAQCLGDGNDRICKVKAVLPTDQWMGWLKIYAGPRAIPQHGQQEKLDSSHYPLALCFRLTRQTQQDEPRSFDFVQLHVCQYEFYVQEPQCYQLYPLQRYSFSVKSNHTHHKLAVRSPNGRLYKLTYYPQDHTYDGTLTVSEVGQWSLVCLLHHAGGLYIVASWECKA